MPETPPLPPSIGVTAEPEIHTIPDKFYGAALKAKVTEAPKPAAPGAPVSPTTKRNIMPAIIVGIVLLVAVAGGFVYFNRSLLFPPSTPPTPVVVTPTPTPVPAPTSPVGVSVTSTNPQSAIISWTDTSSNESGFRIERHDASSTAFVALTNLPPNSTSFLDVTVQPHTTYTYRIIALNTTGESSPSNEATVAVADLPPAAPPAPRLPPAGLDTDSDGLTDVEEAMYGTNPRNPDSDGDGFLDGNEVFNLYDPTIKAPAKLTDSKLVTLQRGSVGWSMVVPSAWTVTLDQADGSKATINTKHGETFVLTIEDNAAKAPIVDWYLANHPEVVRSQLLEYRSKGGYEGIIGPDLLSTYIPWGDKVFVLTYNLDGQTFINYRTTYSMMLNSLVLNGIPVISSTTNAGPLPFEPSATSSGVITLPVTVDGLPISVTSTATTTTP